MRKKKVESLGRGMRRVDGKLFIVFDADPEWGLPAPALRFVAARTSERTKRIENWSPLDRRPSGIIFI